MVYSARVQPARLAVPAALLALSINAPVASGQDRPLQTESALTAPGGDLRVWGTPWHEARVLPALRALLELPFERVIVSHGEPVHDRAAYERALELPPFSDA